jgi:hypothetical protein
VREGGGRGVGAWGKTGGKKVRAVGERGGGGVGGAGGETKVFKYYR